MISSGQTIAGKYRINQLLGSGGMASVWSATNIFTEREFAIKFMLPAVARTPEAARRFLMEAKVSARVNHPNIIEVIDVGQTEDGCLFLVMELLTGVSLETAIKRQTPPMSVAEFTGVMLLVARALAAAHKSGVIHRDLKPTNIFLHKDREGAAVAKILDFGVSKFLEEEGQTSLTIAGTVLGSPLYMSPEQAMGAAIDLRTDVFAFGTILFEGLCGYRAYEAPNFNALIVKIATTQPKQIDECAPKLPEALRAVVRDCMMTDQEKRLGTFEVVADRLAAALPELERSKLLLPLPTRQLGEPPTDPDATNALPLLRGNSAERHVKSVPPPPTSTPNAGGPRSGNGPASGFSKPTTPASGHVAETTLSHPRRAYMAGAVVVGLAAAAGIIGVIRAASGAPHSLPSSRVDPTPVAAAADPPPAPTGSVPVISVDSLPVAPSAEPLHGTGRLLIGASPGWCAITIDGMKRGPTPLPAIDLSTGLHVIRCDSPSGKTKTDSIYIKDGATARHRFTID
jgi:eukaryotic-like serine/threonine-protein kinase